MSTKSKYFRTDAAERIAAKAQDSWGWRADAAPSLFLQRELQDIEGRMYETPFAPLKADLLIPVRQIARGAQESGHDRVTHFGMARWLAGSAKDLPRVNAQRRRTLFPVRSMAVEYVFNQEEIEAAAMSSQPLQDTMARAARRAIDTFRNKVAMSGDSDLGMTGFTNDPNVPAGNATNGSWNTASADDIIHDLNEAWIDVWTQSKEAFRPDTMAIPTSLYGLISSTPRSANSDTTILAYFLANQEFVRNVVPVLELETAGAGSTGRLICYLKDIEVLEQPVAIPFEQRPPTFSALEVSVACWCRTGGMGWKAPIAAVYRDGL